MRAFVLALSLALGACADRPHVGVTITNSPSTLPDCMGKPGGGGCR